ncbi:hypothetical protein FBU59_005230 [Linderina macrospora]|uniref:Uncharacterized protein n=1 Tax=Linderina macrospora TaxID=4868 RepID=A0ACC1J3G2_9FUNG|nr:hypothetical protein FBU59_005230 [Linderina macrospora]
MVGTYMWKYTSTRFKATGSHERRHMRYFWILPYAKTLYWGKEPMSTSMTLSRSARVSGSRSVYMRDIRIVPDQHDSGSHDEPQYCIIVTTNHREVKIKATSQADHDMWYMAMAYLQNRRIITSTTYPSNTFVNDLSEYPSDTSAHSMATSMGSGTALPLHQRLLNRAESRGILSRNQARHTMAAPAPVAGGSRSAPRPHSEMPPSHPGTTPGQQGATMFSQGSYASQFSNQESMASSNISGGHPRQGHGSPSTSLQSTPKALRPVSVVAPTSGSGNEGKRISIGLFRRDGTGSGLLRNGSQQSDGSYVSIGGGSPSALRPADSRSMQQPQSIAAAISTTTLHHRENSSSSASRTVRKMFSGSILRVLRSREHEDSGNGPV